jgi:hypothetical protein
MFEEIMGIKVVYNACYGGFSLSRKAAERLLELGVTELREILEAKRRSSVFGDSYYLRGVLRHDPRLVQVIEELGDDASGSCANLRISEIDGDRYHIDEYDGFESVRTTDNIDWIVVK